MQFSKFILRAKLRILFVRTLCLAKLCEHNHHRANPSGYDLSTLFANLAYPYKLRLGQIVNHL